MLALGMQFLTRLTGLVEGLGGDEYADGASKRTQRSKIALVEAYCVWRIGLQIACSWLFSQG